VTSLSSLLNWQFSEVTLLLLGFAIAWVCDLHGRLFAFIRHMITGRDGNPPDVM
jgi:hypothetical protein